MQNATKFAQIKCNRRASHCHPCTTLSSTCKSVCLCVVSCTRAVSDCPIVLPYVHPATNLIPLGLQRRQSGTYWHTVVCHCRSSSVFVIARDCVCVYVYVYEWSSAFCTVHSIGCWIRSAWKTTRRRDTGIAAGHSYDGSGLIFKKFLLFADDLCDIRMTGSLPTATVDIVIVATAFVTSLSLTFDAVEMTHSLA